MIEPQWVICCGCITFQTLSLSLRPLGRCLGSTILIRLMYAKTQSVSLAHQWHTCWASLWKKKQKAWVIFTRVICYWCRDKREELQHCSCNGALKCGGYCEECQLDMQTLERSECKKAAVYDLLRTGMVGEGASASFYKVSWKRHHNHKIYMMCMKKRANWQRAS